MVLDLASPKAILQYWSALSDRLKKAQPEFARRFGEICASHTDYIWEMVN